MSYLVGTIAAALLAGFGEDMKRQQPSEQQGLPF